MNTPQVKHIDPLQAREILLSTPDARIIDVRTKMEYDYVGHPVGAVHVAWMESPEWDINPSFVDQTIAALQAISGPSPQSIPVLTLCRSGKRSLAAAQELTRQGFTDVYNIDEGFEGQLDSSQQRGTLNGWRSHGLPWEQT